MNGRPIRTDEQLIADYYGGDDRAFSEIEKRYWKAVFALAMVWGFEESDCQDIAQETMCKVVATKGTGRVYQPQRRASFKTWIYRIATNVMIDAKERGRKRGAKEIQLESIGEAPDPRYSPPEEAALPVWDVRECLEALPLKEKIVLLYIIWEENPQTDMAKKEGISDAAVSQRKKTALHKMEECLKRKGYE